MDGRISSRWKSSPRSVSQSHHGVTKGCLPLERCSSGWRGWLQLEVFSQKCASEPPWALPTFRKVFQWMAGLAPAGSLFPVVSLRATMGSPRAAPENWVPFHFLRSKINIGSFWQQDLIVTSSKTELRASEQEWTVCSLCLKYYYSVIQCFVFIFTHLQLDILADLS